MKIAITGAGGFIGRRLVDALRARRFLRGGPIERLILVDRGFADPPADPLIATIAGDFGHNACREAVAQAGPDLVFHLAAIPGGAAEADFPLGRQVNLEAPLALFDRLAKPGLVVVNASSLAVFGAPLPRAIADDTLPVPTLSYGAHKLMLEIYLADLSRRAKLDARSLRLPGIVARPPAPTGHVSAFMSDIFHALARGEAFVCPTRPQGAVLLESVETCVANLIHAAELPAARLPPRRALLLPCLRVTMAQLAAAIFRARGRTGPPPITYAPDATIEAQYAAYPPTTTAIADALGFLNDGDVDALARRVLQGLPMDDAGNRI
ncbi:MAG: NAD-dependent epimerase/dehydratase family protein [Pseudomonadota bacterium]|nr:NAD-dependent epimerase/dehydratase family protein [Pseudomonadota bacterium]